MCRVLGITNFDYARHRRIVERFCALARCGAVMAGDPPGHEDGWGVITSYSIHYTKLYELTVLCWRTCILRRGGYNRGVGLSRFFNRTQTTRRSRRSGNAPKEIPT